MGHYNFICSNCNVIVTCVKYIFDVIKHLSPKYKLDMTVFFNPRKTMSPSGKPSGDIVFLWLTNRHIQFILG